MEILNKIAQEVHQNAINKGFYDPPVELGTQLMLITSELSEALEADRHGRRALTDLFDEKLEGDKFMDEYETLIKGSFDEEAIDAIIRLFDTCASRAVDIDKHIRLKMKYNSLRPYKHGKKY